MLPVEGVGHDRKWGAAPKKCPVSCKKIAGNGCYEPVCVAGRFEAGGEPEAHDFKDTCSAMEKLADLTSVVTLHISLGKCHDLFSAESKYLLRSVDLWVRKCRAFDHHHHHLLLKYSTCSKY